MFGKRDFLDSSSSSFETDQVGTPPPYQQDKLFSQHHENEFDFEDKPNSKQDFFTAPIEKPRGIPITSTGATFQPIKKEQSEKVNIVNFVEEQPDELQNRPTTSVRPGSSSAQMRAKMLEAQKSKLMSRPGGNMSVQSSNLLISGKGEATPLDNLIYSNNVYTEKDISGSKALKAFNTGGGIKYEPNALRAQTDIIPGPIKAERTVIRSDDIEEVKLEENMAIRNVPSKTLQEMHKKIEESQKITTPVYVPPPPPAPVKVVEIQQERPRIDERFKAEEIPKYEEKPKVVEQRPIKVNEPQPQHERLRDPESTLGEEETKGGPDRMKRTDLREEVKEQPKPIPKPPTVNIREILANEMRDMRRFLLSPVNRGITLQCTIRRDKSGFNRLFPKYFMSISEGLTFLLAGKKRAGNRTSNYMVTMNQKDFNTKSPSFLGKVRSNFLGTEFMMYDNGLNPKRKGANPSNVRTELGVVLYVYIYIGIKYYGIKRSTKNESFVSCY